MIPDGVGGGARECCRHDMRSVGDVTAVIEVEGLRKEFRRRKAGRVRAVDGLNLSVPAGGVFGFLGPNGSGKTTTIRCLLGLSRPSAGHCRLLGADSPRELPGVIDRVGALVETPGLTSGVSARQTLEILATTVGIGHARVDAVLERVGLSDRAEDRGAATRSVCANDSAWPLRC